MKFYLLSILAIASILFVLNPVYAAPAVSFQDLNGTVSENNVTQDISITTDKTSYNQNDTINISGQISGSSPYSAVTIKVLGPNNNMLFMGQLMPNSDGTFTKSLQAIGQYWKTSGNYTIVYQYDSIEQQKIFYLDNSTSSEIVSPIVTPTPSLSVTPSVNTTVQFNETNQTTSLPVISEPVNKIPNWVRSIFIAYGNNEISENDLITALKFLIDNNIIVLG